MVTLDLRACVSVSDLRAVLLSSLPYLQSAVPSFKASRRSPGINFSPNVPSIHVLISFAACGVYRDIRSLRISWSSDETDAIFAIDQGVWEALDRRKALVSCSGAKRLLSLVRDVDRLMRRYRVLERQIRKTKCSLRPPYLYNICVESMFDGIERLEEGSGRGCGGSGRNVLRMCSARLSHTFKTSCSLRSCWKLFHATRLLHRLDKMCR